MLGVSLSRGSSAASHSLISLNGHYASSRRSSARPLTSSRCPPPAPFSPTSVPAGGRGSPAVHWRMKRDRGRRGERTGAQLTSPSEQIIWGGAVLWTHVACFQVIPSNDLVTETRRSTGCYTNRQPLNQTIVQPAVCIVDDSNKLHDGSQIIHQNNHL